MTGKELHEIRKRIQANVKIISTNLNQVCSEEVLQKVEKNTIQVKNYVLDSLMEPEKKD